MESGGERERELVCLGGAAEVRSGGGKGELVCCIGVEEVGFLLDIVSGSSFAEDSDSKNLINS